MVRMGDHLGLYKTLHASGPLTLGEPAKKAGIAERYAREWLSHQAASSYLDYEPASGGQFKSKSGRTAERPSWPLARTGASLENRHCVADFSWRIQSCPATRAGIAP
jgi:hypothetical protein